jgi:hypothetical protein
LADLIADIPSLSDQDRVTSVINIPLSSIFVWVAVKPYYIKWKKSHGSAYGSCETPVELEDKSNG